MIYKKTIYYNLSTLALYYANYAQGEKTENYAKAIDVAKQMEALYPDTTSEEYKYAENIRSQLQSALDKFNKSKSGGSGSSSGKTQNKK